MRDLVVKDLLKRRRLALGLAALFLGVVLLSSCASRTPDIKALGLGPLPPVPVPADNPMTPEKVELGKLLFFDGRLSGDLSTPCSACHLPSQGWGDGNAISRGYPGTKHWRNSQTILNSAYYTKLFWAGEVSSLERQADAAFTGNLAGNLDPHLAEERLRQVPEYVERFQKVFGGPPIYANVLKAVAAFKRTIVSKNVPFDNYAQGDQSALSSKAKEGLALFAGKAQCVGCHSGALFSNQGFAAIGVPESDEFKTDVERQIALRFQHFSRGVSEAEYRKADRDLGLYYTTKRDEDRNKFRVPSLRDLKYTAPYMHNGVFKTLEEVVEFYNQGGGDVHNKDPRLKALKLSEGEKKALVEFLLSLSGDPVLVEPLKLPEYAPGIPNPGGR